MASSPKKRKRNSPTNNNNNNNNNTTEGIGLQILRNLNTDVFVKTRATKTTPSINSSILVFRIGRTNKSYGVKRIENGRVVYEEPTEAEIKLYESYLDIACDRLCKFTVTKGYIKDEYNEVPVSIMVFSRGKKRPIRVGQASKRKKTSPSRLVITGLVTMIEVLPKRKKTMYIPLICSKGGQGNSLLKLAEEITKLFGNKRVEMTSLDAPLGFYLYKGYSFMDGKDTYLLPDKTQLTMYSEHTDASGVSRIVDRKLTKKNRKKLGFMNNDGRFYNQKHLPTLLSLLPGVSGRAMRNRLKSSKYALGFGNALTGIKYVEGRGIYLFKNL